MIFKNKNIAVLLAAALRLSAVSANGCIGGCYGSKLCCPTMGAGLNDKCSCRGTMAQGSGADECNASSDSHKHCMGEDPDDQPNGLAGKWTPLFRRLAAEEDTDTVYGNIVLYPPEEDGDGVLATYYIELGETPFEGCTGCTVSIYDVGSCDEVPGSTATFETEPFTLEADASVNGSFTLSDKTLAMLEGKAVAVTGPDDDAGLCTILKPASLITIDDDADDATAMGDTSPAATVIVSTAAAVSAAGIVAAAL